MAAGKKWTEQELWRICDMWVDGKTALDIGKEFGVSRASILSQIRKMEMQRKNNETSNTMPA